MPKGWPTSSRSRSVPSATAHGSHVVTRWTGSASAQNTFSRRSADGVSGESFNHAATSAGGVTRSTDRAWNRPALPCFAHSSRNGDRPVWLRQLQQRGLAETYRRTIFANVSGVFAAAIDDERLRRNPCAARSVTSPGAGIPRSFRGRPNA